MAIKTQGTEVYVIDPVKWKDNLEDAVLKIGCIDGLSTGGNPADRIEFTCLDEDSKRSMKGLKTPGELSGTISYDPSNASHKRLFELANSTKREEGNYWFCIGLSDGKGIEPDFDTNGHFDLPVDTSGDLTRSWYVIDGYVADFPLDIQPNTKVDVAFTAQRNSFSGLWAKGDKFTFNDEQTGILENWSNNG